VGEFFCEANDPIVRGFSGLRVLLGALGGRESVREREIRNETA
jgi:hypothetical protein